MNLFTAAIYAFLKMLVFITTRIFYAKFTVINKQGLKIKNPAMVVSNHPSTLLDPLNVGVEVPKQMYFLANAGLFKNPVAGAILNQYCIPIERPKDVKGRRIKNDENFAKADAHLTKGRCIYVAAEGTSVVERRIRKVKTGTARIALSAENKNDFKLGLTIIPIGLNYTDPLNFQGEVLLNVGQPIKALDYQEAYEVNPFHAAKKMTADLQHAMESLVFHTDNEELDQLLVQIETVLASEETLSPQARFFQTKKILEQLKDLEEGQQIEFQNSGNHYFNLLEKEAVKDRAVVRNIKRESSFPDFLKLIFGFPFFLYGWINNFSAFFIPGFLAKKIKIFPGYKPAIMTLAGLILLPLFFYIQTKLVSYFIDIDYIGWIYLLTLLPMGWIAWQYRKLAVQFFQDRKVRQFKMKSSTGFEALTKQRNNFLTLINQIHK